MVKGRVIRQANDPVAGGMVGWLGGWVATLVTARVKYLDAPVGFSVHC